ncbi:MAG: DUF547 domain-containing protein [Psychroserpens sp.]|nr:DUF547 domain-containing protein [Psychroserpens sp.]
MTFRPIFICVSFCFLVGCGTAKQTVNKQSKPVKEEVVSVEKNIIEDKEILADSSTTQNTNVAVEKDIEVTIPNKAIVDHSLWNELLQDHVSDDGKVSYSGLKSDKTKLYSYVTQLQESVPESTWSKDTTLAYWINAYNAFTVDLILRNYPLESIKDVKDPWDQRLWKIGSKWYNLNDIEHQILRKLEEPRIHFAIVCASVSCPNLANFAYTESELEAQLEQVTRTFLADPSKNIISENDLQLSKIFKWFSKDFKTNGSLIEFVNRYTEIDISETARKGYLDYNWDLNE